MNKKYMQKFIGLSVIGALFLLLLAACGQSDEPAESLAAVDRPESTAQAGNEAQTDEKSEPLRLEANGEVPFYARFGENETFANGEWAVVIFYRSPDCIPADFNLNQFFHFPDENGPGAFGCAPPTATSVELWANSPETDPAPLVAEMTGRGAVPVWFFAQADIETALADGVVTIGELAAIPSRRVGTAVTYTELLHPGQSNAQPLIQFAAEGTLEDGDCFTVDVSQGAPDVADHTTLLINGCDTAVPKTYPAGSLAAYLAADGRFTTFLALTDEVIHEESPPLLVNPARVLTLFAPTDEAFAAMPPDLLTRLKGDPRLAEELLFHHTFDRPLQSKDFGLLPTWPTIITPVHVAFAIDGDEIRYDGADGALVIEKDIQIGNNFIHIIDAVTGLHLLTD